MFHNSEIEDSIELWGECFSRSSRGLDEEQVKAFIGRLISEREILLEREKQLKSLAQQGEKITLEAEKVANDIRKKAEETARIQARYILDKAKEEAERIYQQKINEAREEAREIVGQAVAYTKKCMSEGETKANKQAKDVIMKAIAESNRIVENKRIEAEAITRKALEEARKTVIASAQERLRAVEAEAEALAQSQAQAILSSDFKPTDD